ncbi:AAA family ATPase [Streptomyces sp. NPDC048272]|uniref:ATP-binding protein n=1 Tax=Streptomyces sp. NPDC048272 TaxID=3154616 RepID=UPI00341AE229
MRFIVLEADGPPGDGGRACLLEPAPWPDDDFVTLYHLWFRDGDGGLDQLGPVKIAYADLIRDERPLKPGEFTELTGHDLRLHWFSLGQSDSYYENIRQLGVDTRLEILQRLCDIAFSSAAFDTAMGWDVTQTSLLRSVTPQTVEVQFRRIAHGGPRLTAYHFAYRPPTSEAGAVTGALSFSVEPHSRPPTNIHVLIGRNGVGKTTLLGNVARAVLDSGVEGDHAGEITWPGSTPGSFANVVVVAFSAFDPTRGHRADDFDVDEEGHPQLQGWDGSKDVSGDQTPLAEPVTEPVSYTYVGLSKVDELGRPTHERKSYADLADEFGRSVEEIMAAGRVGRWIDALDKLGSDPHFYESPIHGFARVMQTREELFADDGVTAREIFASLSSGHAIILLTLTRLVETVAEQSLVLLDEPEAHLHPPLLASFIRALSDLLTERNGVALIGTHSPVVLQEMPRSCVWKVSRFDRRAPERPTLETYGENVGILTHEVFNLEVRESGFHAEIEKAVNELGSYERVLTHFGGQLGGEAKGLVRILLAHRSTNGPR